MHKADIIGAVTVGLGNDVRVMRAFNISHSVQKPRIKPVVPRRIIPTRGGTALKGNTRRRGGRMSRERGQTQKKGKDDFFHNHKQQETWGNVRSRIFLTRPSHIKTPYEWEKCEAGPHLGHV